MTILSTQRLGAAVLGMLSLVLVASAGAATPPPAPSVTTGPLTSVTPTSATVSGSVNPNGSPATWYVDYGETTSYGSKSASMNAGSGTTAVNVSATLNGLSAGTTYHYRFVASNTGGTAQGADAILSTPSAPGATTAAATGVASTTATLNGTVEPNGRDTTWNFEYGTSTSYGTKTPAQDAGAGTSPVNVSVPISGLKTGKTYHFRLDATSDAGTTKGPDLTFTTVSVPTVATGAATSVGSTTAKLNGSVNPNGQAATWYFEYGTTTSYGAKTAVKSAGSGTSASSVSASLAGLAPSTTYHFRIDAVNAAGTALGNDQSFTTTGPPIAQTGAAQAVASTTATVTGTVYPRGGSTSWYFEYGTTTKYGSKTASKSAGASATTGVSVNAALAGLLAGTTYHYRLVAVSRSGTSDGADLTFSTMQAVTLRAAATQVVFGHYVTLSGTASAAQPGITVTILAQPFGTASLVPVSTVLTGAGGGWSYPAKPTILTTYQAMVPGGSSSTVMVGVAPALSLHRITNGRLATVAAASTSFAGRVVQLQRLAHGRWVTVRRARLSSRSGAVFSVRVLPHGTSRVRIAMSVNAAGPGYLAGFSRTITIHRG
jgi:phosphodiesterase/alkaline phosphatase D-like protein